MKNLLTHFSQEPFEFDSNFDYLNHSKLGHYSKIGKPTGLWLSDETDFGWKQWCEGEEFRLETLAHEKKFEVNLEELLVLDSDRKIIDFNKEYTKPILPDCLMLTKIDWSRIMEKYKGILISPYSWELRLASGYMWYYGWDCASACVWDLSALKEVKA